MKLRRISAAIIALLSLSILLVCGVSGPSQGSPGMISATDTEAPFGIHGMQPSEVSNVAALGALIVRFPANLGMCWGLVEEPTGTWNWNSTTPPNTPHDTNYLNAANAGVDMLVQILSLNNDDHKAGKLPVDLDAYAAFVTKAVERYDGDGIDDAPGSPRVKYWQLENEPDGTWKDGPQNFAVLVKTTYRAMKQADPDAKLVLAGVMSGEEGLTDFYGPMMDHLNFIKDNPDDQYFDVFDFHLAGAAGSYRAGSAASTGIGVPVKTYVNDINQLLADHGYSVPIWITEMSTYSGDPGVTNLSAQTEQQQAEELLKMYVYPLSLGIKKVFWVGLAEWLWPGYYSHVGLIYDGKGSDDPGQGVKKLAYYTYKKTVELLDGSDWNSIETVRESNNVYIYKFMKNGSSVYAAWWDYFSDPAYTPGKTLQVKLTGVQGSSAISTEAVPKFAAGAEVTDYSSAFNTNTLLITNGTVTLSLGTKPVFVEVLP